MKRILLMGLLPIFLIQCGERPKFNIESKGLTIATGLPIGKIDPFKTTGIEANLIDLIYEPLFALSPEGKILPKLAKSIEWDQENNLLIVVLKEPLADGTIHSVNQSKKLIGGVFYQGLGNLDSIKKMSPHEIHFKLKTFDRAFLYQLSKLPIVPLDKKRGPTGPFMIMKESQDEIVLQRKRYSEEKVNRINIKVIPSTKRAIRELVAGSVDLLFFPTETDYQVIEDIPEIRREELTTRILYQVLENQRNLKNKPPWGFLNQQFDRDEFIASMNINEFVPAPFPIPSEDYDSFPEVLRGENKNSKAAKKNGENRTRILSFLGQSPRDSLIARHLKRQFEKFGINIRFNGLNPRELNQKIFVEKNFDLVLLPVNVKDTLVTNYFIFHTPEGPHSINFSGYSNSKVDEFLEKARYTKEDKEARKALDRALYLMLQDPPGLFLYWLKTPVVYRKACSGFKFNSSEFFSSLKDVRCEP